MQNINDLYKENSINICISTFPLCFMKYILILVWGKHQLDGIVIMEVFNQLYTLNTGLIFPHVIFALLPLQTKSSHLEFIQTQLCKTCV